MKTINTSIHSNRNTDIPVTIVETNVNPCRLLICAHGFKANRTEDGRFLQVAQALAENGVMSIMMGFPGCDVSKEDFLNYSLTSCMDDIDNCYRYIKDNYDIDPDHVGMIGYSMGGRLTSLYIKKHPEIRCIGIWAGACYDGFGGDSFLGVGTDTLKNEEKKKGYCDFLNSFDNTYIKLSKQLIEDMENMSPVEGLNGYTGDAIVVHGDKDITVPYEQAFDTYASLIHAEDRKLLTVEGADHGFGAWDDHPELSKQLTDNTIAYFKEHLCGN